MRRWVRGSKWRRERRARGLLRRMARGGEGFVEGGTCTLGSGTGTRGEAGRSKGSDCGTAWMKEERGAPSEECQACRQGEVEPWEAGRQMWEEAEWHDEGCRRLSRRH